jgi:RAMA domain-containing protein/uncharacterized protein DUF6416
MSVSDGVSPVAAKLLTILISVTPEQIGADDLAEALEIESGARGVAGVLSGITAKAAALDRRLPVMWQEGEPSTYWIERGTAATLLAGKHSATAADESSAGQTRVNKLGDLAALLEAGLIAAGDQLTHVRPRTGDSFSATVTRAGAVVTELGTYDSPSPALSELVGNSRNGWTDWTHVPSGSALDALRQKLP